MSNIAKNIRQYREDHNLTQQELALKLRMGTKKIEMYESGEVIPDTQSLFKVALSKILQGWMRKWKNLFGK